MKIEKLISERDAIIELTKKYVKTLDELKNKIQQIGDRIERKIELARSFEQAGDILNEKQLWDIALKNYSIGIEILPRDPYLNYKMGLILSNMGLVYYSEVREYWAKAESFYLRSIESSPNFSKSYYGLALLYLNYYEKNIDVTKLPKALEYINKYVNLSPQDPKGYFLKGRILYNMDNKGLALQAYNHILNITKENSQEYNEALKMIKLIKEGM